MISPWPRTRRGRDLIALLGVPLLATLAAFFSVPGEYGADAVKFSFVVLLSSLFFTASLLLHLHLAPRLGRFTSVAALSVVWALVFLVVALLSPTCPATIDGDRCTSLEAGTWMLSGALVPIMWGVLLLPFAFLVRVGRSLSRRWAESRRLEAKPAPRGAKPGGKAAGKPAAKGGKDSAPPKGSVVRSKQAAAPEPGAVEVSLPAPRPSSKKKSSGSRRVTSKKRRPGR